ncbi:MAG: single-stranded-DNA-specific exonuclease RecJ [Parvibaculaceae bacterium]|nr:single-stranded-DNA-specific exonuclease RecJ [Parvibaculaceae bacterium]
MEYESDSGFLGVGRSLTGRRWMPRLADDRKALQFSQSTGVPELLSRVLAGRGVQPDQCEQHLDPTLKHYLPDPSSVTDMDKAALRIAKAIQTGEQVAVFGDYDVDGATSSALLKRYFEMAGAHLRVYIPDRIKEGYGPNAPAFMKLKELGVSLIITVDCGTMAHKPLGIAREKGLDVVVVDHHQAEPALPPAHAIVNPNRLDDTSGLGQLAAVGVVFLLLVALNRTLRAAGWFTSEREEPKLLDLLDLAALGTVCDVVPLTGLNRAFVRQGLRIMGARKNVGLAALGDVSRLEGMPGTYHAGFLLGPRVNAGGRVGRADLGARLLTTHDPLEAEEIAAALDTYNKERQAIEAMVQEEAMAQVEQMLADARLNQPPPMLIVAHKGWHPGVIGIVASRIKDKYDRPTFVIAIDQKGEGKGSGRSIPGVDLGRAVTAALEAGLLVNGGGHSMAAGLTVDAQKLDKLSRFLSDRVAGDVMTASEARELKLDGAMVLKAASREAFEMLEQAGPYGAGNAEPRFAVPRVRIVRADRVGQNHVRCILAGDDGGRLKAIAFRQADSPLGMALLDAGSALFHVAGRLKADDWQGRRDVQLQIDDAVRL